MIPTVYQEGLPTRAKVQYIEDRMRELPQVAFQYKHYFSPGVYARELFIPAGTLLTGMIHKYTQLNIMSQGEMDVLVEDKIVRVRAPFTVVSPPGTKRIAYAYTDTVWTTILGTHLDTVEEIEEHFIAKSEEEYLLFLEETKCLS